MSFSLLSIALILIFIVISAIEVFRYVNKGLTKSLLAFGSSIMSIMLSIILSPGISGGIVSLIFSLVIKNTPAYTQMTADFPSTDSLILAISTAVLNTVMFVIVFFVFRRIIRAVISLICKYLIKKNSADPGYAKDKEVWYRKYENIFSGIIGGLSGFMICMLLVSPIMGTAETIDKLAEIADASDPGILDRYTLDGEAFSSIKNDLDYISDDAVGNVFYQLGGKHLYNASACADIEYNRIYLSNELDAADLILTDFSILSRSLEENQMLTVNDVDALYSLSDHIQDVELLHYVAADLLSTCSNAWLDGKLFLGFEKPTMHPVVDGAIDDVLMSCAQTDEKSAKMNINTLIRLYALILESEIMNVDTSDYAALIAFVDNSDIIGKVNSELSANPYMNGISVSSIAISAIADSISVETIGVENYNKLMNNIAEAIEVVNGRGYGSAEEKVEVLTTYAQKYISEYDLDVPDSIAEVVAEELLNVLSSSESGEVTAKDISDLINKYK